MHGSLTRVVDKRNWGAPLVLFVTLAVILCLACMKMYSDYSSDCRIGESSGMNPELRSSHYDSVNEDESDAGDWNMEDIMGGVTQMFQTGDGEVRTFNSSRQYHKSDEDYDPEGVTKHIETSYTSWRLLGQILGALAQFWAALAFMYWSLLYRDDELMNCRAYAISHPHAFWTRHGCYYTLACLKGFPILAANVEP